MNNSSDDKNILIKYIDECLQQPKVSNKMPTGKVLHVFDSKVLRLDIKALCKDLKIGVDSDEIFISGSFASGFVPRDFSKNEIERYLESKTYEDDYENNNKFFDTLASGDSLRYDEVIYWCEYSTHALMLGAVLCSQFRETKLSVVPTERGLFGMFSKVIENFDHRLVLDSTIKKRVADLWNKDEWNKDKIFRINDDGKIEEFPIEEMEAYIISQLLPNEEYTVCSRLLGNCMGYQKKNQKYGTDVYIDVIYNLIEEGRLVAVKYLSDEDLEKRIVDMNVEEYISAPNGVNISNVTFFGVKLPD